MIPALLSSFLRAPRPAPPTFAAGLLACAGLVLAAATATAGTLTGRVLDAGSGNFLHGAEITVEGSALRTTTERDGRFELSHLPAGTHRVTATYPGLDASSQPVEVGADTSTTLTFALRQGVLELDRLVVRGAKEGMAQAVALQKISVQTKMVAAADQFGEVSEGNVGEYLKFLPGVSIDYNVNDARGVSLRGLSTAFTIVAVDGTPMAGTSSVDDTRRFEFEQIAMNNVETTELYKTVTPDIPASSTGGFVNFVTKSAFDTQDEQRFSYNVSFSAPATNVAFGKESGVWGHHGHYLIRPSADLNFSRRLTPKLGVNFSYRLSEKYDDSPRTTATWNVQTNSTGAPTIFTATPRLGTFAVRSEQKLTHRQAFATKLDYHLGDATKLTVSGQWNWYDLNFTQRGPTFALGTNATANGGSYTSGTGAAVTAAQAGTITNGVLYRNKYGTTYHTNATLTHEFSSGTQGSLTAYYSRANGQYRDTSKGFISSASTLVPGAATYSSFTITGLDRELPAITLTQGATPVPLDFIRSLGNYTYSNTATGTNFQSRPWTALDTKQGLSGDYSRELAHLPVPVKIKTGFATDEVLRFIHRPDLRGSIAATTGPALTALADPGYTKDVAFGFGSYQVVDPYKVWETHQARLVNLVTDDVREFHETNHALYLRGDADLTPGLHLVGGLRWEQHVIDARAQSRANARSKLAQVDLAYAGLYPSLSFKYTPRAHRNLVVRGGVSRTVGHPDYADLLPTITSESAPGLKDGSLSVPDPSLQPYHSTNLDLSVDLYLKNSGVVSLYGYVKDVKNYFIASGMTTAEISSIATDYGYNPAEFASGAVTRNGGSSRLSGLEVSYSQNLAFLPKPFNGLSVQANYTYLDVKARGADALQSLDLEYSQLRAVAPQTANLILGFRLRDLSITTTTNWVSESLFGGFVATSFFTGSRGTATTPDTRLANYRDEKATTDIKVEYAFNPQFAVYLLVRNVFNSQRIDFYRGYLPEHRDVVLPWNRYEFGEPHLTLGFRGRF